MRKRRSVNTLVKRLAGIAHCVSELVGAALEQDVAQAAALREAYRESCEASQSTLTRAEFAGMAAQLLVYSGFVARYYHTGPVPFQRQHITDILHYAHPLHRLCVEAITDGEPASADIAVYIDELVRLLALADRTSINDGFQDDPLTHFYELFLRYYNPGLRASHGIFYTPEPVVSYIIRSLDQLLRTRFAYRDGLADVSGNPQILDPACGTGIFPQAILDHSRAFYIQHELADLWREHLHQYFLPRLTGIEVLMMPYLIAHLRLNLFMADVPVIRRGERGKEGLGGPLWLAAREDGRMALELSVDNGDAGDHKGPPRSTSSPLAPTDNDESVSYHLGNALIVKDIQQLLGWAREDGEEPLMIVLGNPPYMGHSANREAWIMSLLDEYKEGYPELMKRAQAKWLSDDYVKFIRLAQWRIDKAGRGMLAFITNHSYLDNPTFRGMRRSLMRSFDELFVLDLHGNSKKQELSPGDSRDENIFPIQPGVAISIFIKGGDRSHCRDGGGEDVEGGPWRSPLLFEPAIVHYAHLWGSRAEKLSWLAAHDLESTAWVSQQPHAPFYLFAPQETHYEEEYEAGWSIPDIFRPNGDPAPGIITCHDEFAIAWSRDDAISKVEWLLATRDEDEARQRYRLCAQEQWSYAAAKQALSNDDWRQQLTPVLYRPFDTRWTAYNRHVAVHLRERVTRHMLAGCVPENKGNLALLIGKAGQVINQHSWDIVFCTRLITDFNLFRRGGNNLFPLYLYEQGDRVNRRVNLAPYFIAEITRLLGLRWLDDGHGDLRDTVGPEDIYAYIYAILHSPAYRERYAPFLKRDFPRIPLPPHPALLSVICGLGEKLMRLHLMESETRSLTCYPIEGSDRVELVRFTPAPEDETMGRVWINPEQYFTGVSRAAWTLHIGGYQVCQKWLKDRRGRALSLDDIQHYQRIVAVLTETMHVMSEIDSAIEQAGGWPL